MLDSLAERNALADLYRDHAGWLLGWVRRRLGQGELAPDLVQATFCRLLEYGCATLPRAPRGYLATVARRLLIDDVRRRDLEQAWLDCHAALQGDRNELTPERIVEAAQLLHSILMVLQALPERVGRAFVLRKIEALPHEEIARVLDISTRTVKRHVAQAYALLYTVAFPD